MLQLLALALVMVALPAGSSFGLHNCNSVCRKRLFRSHPQPATHHLSGTCFGACSKVHLLHGTGDTLGAQPGTFRPRMSRGPTECFPCGHGHGFEHAQRQHAIRRICGWRTKGLANTSAGAHAEGSLKHPKDGQVCTASVFPRTGVLVGFTPSSSSSAAATSWPSSSSLSMHTATVRANRVPCHVQTCRKLEVQGRLAGDVSFCVVSLLDVGICGERRGLWTRVSRQTRGSIVFTLTTTLPPGLLTPALPPRVDMVAQ